METSQELIRAKQTLYDQLDVAYKIALGGANTFEVATDKFVTITGGSETLWTLQDAYASLFTDPDVPETDGAVKQADGSLVMCSREEWNTLMKLMRLEGRQLFIKNETLLAMIDALVVTDTFAKIWDTTWENLIL